MNLTAGEQRQGLYQNRLSPPPVYHHFPYSNIMKLLFGMYRYTEKNSSAAFSDFQTQPFDHRLSRVIVVIAASSNWAQAVA